MNLPKSPSLLAGLSLAVALAAGCAKPPPAPPAERAGPPVKAGSFSFVLDPAAPPPVPDVQAEALMPYLISTVVRDGLLTNPPASVELWSDPNLIGSVEGNWMECPGSYYKLRVIIKNFATEDLNNLWVVFTDVAPASHVACWPQFRHLIPPEIVTTSSSSVVGVYPEGTRSQNYGPLAGALTDATLGGEGIDYVGNPDPGNTGYGARSIEWSFDYTVREPITIKGDVWVQPSPQPASGFRLDGTTVRWFKDWNGGFVSSVVVVCPTASPCGPAWGTTPLAEIPVPAGASSWGTPEPNMHNWSAALPDALPSGTYHVFVFNEFMNKAPTPALVRGVYSPGPLRWVKP